MRRSWRTMAALGLVLASASILFSAYLYVRVQNERTRSLVFSCQRDSEQSSAIIGFLSELGSRPRTVKKAREFFPVLTEKECRSRAKRLVGPPPAKR